MTQSVESGARRTGILRENYVKEYFQQQSFAMLMDNRAKARTITCQFYAWK